MFARKPAYYMTVSAIAIAAVCIPLTPAYAQQDVDARLARLEALLVEQSRRLSEQEALLAQQAEQLRAQELQISEHWRVDPAYAYAYTAPSVSAPVGPRGAALTTETLDYWRAGASQDPRQRPPEAPVPESTERQAQLAAIPEGMTVLSRQGQFSFDASAEYSRSSANRLVFRGIEIVPGVQIGVIEANEADRDTLGASLTGRYGITNRLEVDARIPYIKRDDTITTVQQRDEAVTRTIHLKGDGLGDIEAGARYQLNGGQEGRPIFIAGLRVKSDTGEGPFDIPRDEFGVAERLATGSGFWGIEPSISMLMPSDPAVIFANLSYFVHMARDINQREGDILVGEVDPGDSIGGSIGFGFAMNPRFSYSLGYKHNWIRPTETELNNTVEKSDDLQVGSLLFGLSYRINDRFTLNGNFDFGVTEDAPDMRFILRVPIAF